VRYGVAMINGAHVLIYSRDAEADRAFLRDVLGYPYVDTGGGWLIFKLPPAEVGVHPTDGGEAGDREPPTELHLMCDDIEATVARLRERGVEPTRPVIDAGYGIETGIRLPGGAVLGLYQPKHPVAYNLPDPEYADGQ